MDEKNAPDCISGKYTKCPKKEYGPFHSQKNAQYCCQKQLLSFYCPAEEISLPSNLNEEIKA
jgi:hypothetical protein